MEGTFRSSFGRQGLDTKQERREMQRNTPERRQRGRLKAFHVSSTGFLQRSEPAFPRKRPYIRTYCSTTSSPSFRPLSNSVLAPFEIPILTATFFLPSLALVSGTSTEAFLSLS